MCTLDLEPFERINVCGYPRPWVTRLADLVRGCDRDADAAARRRRARRRICCGS